MKRIPKGQIPVDPSLRRGCSAGSAYPRRRSGATGRCTRNAGRAEQRRAREAARGRNEAIAKIVEYDEMLDVSFQLLYTFNGGDGN